MKVFLRGNACPSSLSMINAMTLHVFLYLIVAHVFVCLFLCLLNQARCA